MDKELIGEAAQEQGVEPELLLQLIEYEAGKVHLQGRRGARRKIREIIEASLTEEERS